MPILDPRSLPQHTDRLYRAAWALGGSREDAEDLVQETFARVLSRPRLLYSGDADLPYLLRALRNTFLLGRRTSSRRPDTVTALDDDLAEDPRPIGRPARALEIREVYTTIAELPDDYRLALVAVDVLGLSYREASRALKVPEATITTRLFRARKGVTERLLKPESDADPGARGQGAIGTPGAAPANKGASHKLGGARRSDVREMAG